MHAADAIARDRSLELQRLAVRQAAEIGDPELRHARRLATQASSTCPIVSSAASAIASDRVGWAWIVSSISSTVNSFSRATASSWMISVAWEPMMCAPRISPYLASAMILTKPSVSPAVRARPLAENGKRPTLYSSFRSLHGGLGQSDRRHLGVAVRGIGDVAVVHQMGMRPAMCSATTTPSRSPLCASIGAPATSPIAYTPLTDVFVWLIDLDEPAVGELHARAFSSPMPSTTGCPPGGDEHLFDRERLLRPGRPLSSSKRRRRPDLTSRTVGIGQ